MLRGLLALTLVASLCGAADSLKNLTVGYLTAVKGINKDRQGLAVSGAIAKAIQEVNDDPKLLPGVRLVLKWNDTRGDTVAATRAITDMICEGVYAFFGPEDSCHVESIVAQARNIPMISYKCSDDRPSKVPTFARTEPPNTQVTKSVISLLEYYNWRKFSIVYEDKWYAVAKSLETEALKKKIRVNHKVITKDHHTCCENEEECCHTNFWYNVIQATKNGTRIYVFLGTADSLRDMMSTMKDQELFDKGEYMVIYVDPMPYSSREPMKYLVKVTEDPEMGEGPEKSEKCLDFLAHADLIKQARSLLVVVSSPPGDDYKDFTEQVRTYNSMEPFSFPTPTVFISNFYFKFVSVYAAYLYDSVKLYADALDELLRNQTSQYELPLNDSIIELVASNGTKIIETIIKRGSYKSITGATIKLDKNGDSEGNFSVLAFEYEKLENSSKCFLKSVGQFHQRADNYNPDYRPSATQLNWVGGAKPEDEPSCGFNNEHCTKDDTEKGSVIFAIILAIMLFCVAVSTISIYRKWKIEQEIEGLLWKIEPSDLHGYMVSSPSKVSLVSATSFESRCGAQVFASTGYFRGLVVRVKEVKFFRKKDISREVMKEMRLLRDLRHDNINSFIGAVVEPMRILAITDYCSKGSLYDIVENEDIRLDKMFIASLIHDLIKGMMFLHHSQLTVHGNLKSSNCVVTSRWVLQVSDFGLHELRHCPESDSIGEHQYFRSLLWTAPELLRKGYKAVPTQKADVYAFAIILHEVIGRRGPFGACGLDEPKEIVSMVKDCGLDSPFRPDLSAIQDSEACSDVVTEVMSEAWSEDPELRPDFPTIRARLKGMREGKQRNIMDQMMEMMEKYANNLEDLVNQRTIEVFEEKRKTEDLLHRMLPAPVAKRLTSGYGVEPESFDLVTIYFSDIVGFTAMSAESSPLQVVNFLNDLYTMFDSIIKGYDVYKVETIGDAYMVNKGIIPPNQFGFRHHHPATHHGEWTFKGFEGKNSTAAALLDAFDTMWHKRLLYITKKPGHSNIYIASFLDGRTFQVKVSGLPIRNGNCHAGEIASMSLDLLNAVKNYQIAHRPAEALQLRIGIHTGPVVAGVVGLTMPRYCLFGDTVNTASRMESNGEPLKIHISEKCKESLEKLGGYIVKPRGAVNMKGKGMVHTYWLTGATESSIKPKEVDLTDLPPPLFCRPRKTPYSRLLQLDSRRQSNAAQISRALPTVPETVRGAKSLDVLPLSRQKNLVKRSCHSLQEEAPGVCGNGALVNAPLLPEEKRWHSLETVPPEPCSKKGPRSSLRSWIFGLFNNNSYRSSDGSLRKGGYQDLQPERESIV